MSKTPQSDDNIVPPSTAHIDRARLQSLALQQIEHELISKTASSQILSSFLSETSEKTRLELQKLRSENEYLRSKVAALNAAGDVRQIYKEVMDALSRYGFSGGA